MVTNHKIKQNDTNSFARSPSVLGILGISKDQMIRNPILLTKNLNTIDVDVDLGALDKFAKIDPGGVNSSSSEVPVDRQIKVEYFKRVKNIVLLLQYESMLYGEEKHLISPSNLFKTKLVHLNEEVGELPNSPYRKKFLASAKRTLSPLSHKKKPLRSVSPIRKPRSTLCGNSGSSKSFLQTESMFMDLSEVDNKQMNENVNENFHTSSNTRLFAHRKHLQKLVLEEELTALISTRRPSREIKLIAAAVQIIIAPPDEIPNDIAWCSVTARMQPVGTFIDTLSNFDTFSVPQYKLSALKQFMGKIDLAPEAIRKISPPAAALSAWVYKVLNSSQAAIDKRKSESSESHHITQLQDCIHTCQHHLGSPSKLYIVSVFNLKGMRKGELLVKAYDSQTSRELRCIIQSYLIEYLHSSSPKGSNLNDIATRVPQVIIVNDDNYLVVKPQVLEDCEIYQREIEKYKAATKIQAVQRGRSERRTAKAMQLQVVVERQNEPGVEIAEINLPEEENILKTLVIPSEVATLPDVNLEDNVAALKIQSVARGRKDRNKVRKMKEHKKHKKHEIDVMAHEQAARKIQAVARGKIDRTKVRQIKEIKKQNLENGGDNGDANDVVFDISESQERVQNEVNYDCAAVKIQSVSRGRKDRKKVKQIKQERLTRKAETNLAATKIQSVSRGRQKRRNYKQKKKDMHTSNNAATKIQSVSRGRQGRKRVQRIKNSEEEKSAKNREFKAWAEYFIKEIISSAIKNVKSREKQLISVPTGKLL